jgi:hypothetical protein
MQLIAQKSLFVNNYFSFRVLRPPSQPDPRPRRRPSQARRVHFFAEKTGKNTQRTAALATNRRRLRKLRNSPPVRLLTHTQRARDHTCLTSGRLTSGRLDGSYAAKNTGVSVAKRPVGAPVGANWPISTVRSATKRCYKFNKDELGGCLKRQTPCIIRPVVHNWR